MKILRWCRTAGSFILSAVLLISVLTISVGAVAPAAGPMLEPQYDSGLHVERLGTTTTYGLLGWTLPPTGSFTAGNYLDSMQAAPAGYERAIYHDATLDNTQLGGDDIVSTGDVMELREIATDRVVDRLTIVIRGDVLGIGQMNICQLDRMQELIGQPITDVYLWAADMNWDGEIIGDGRINNDDLMAAAQILTSLDGVNGETVTKAPASLSPILTVLPEATVEQGDLITVRIENQAFGTEALIDVDPTLLRYEGHVGLGTEDHLLLIPADVNNDYSCAEYTYTVLAKPGSTIPFSLTNAVVRASNTADEPMSVDYDPWTTVQVGGSGLSFSPEACAEVSGPDTAYVGEEIAIQVTTPADALDYMARVTTTGLQFLGVEAVDGAADSCTESKIDWVGGSRILTYRYKVTAYAGDPVRFVLSDSIAYLTKYGASIAGGQTSWSARADAGVSYPMITLRNPANGTLQASLLPSTSQATPTPAPTTTPAATSPAATTAPASTPTAEPSYSTSGGEISFRSFAKGRQAYLTATAQPGYVLSSVTASSGDYTLTYNRKDLSNNGTGRFGVDGKFYVSSKSDSKAELRFTVPALNVVISAKFITQAEADAEDAAPTETLTPSPSPSASETVSSSPSPSASETVSPSPSPSETVSPSPSPSSSETPSASPSPSETLTPNPTPSPTIPPTRTPDPTEPPISYSFDLPSGSGLRVATTNTGMPYIGGSGLRVTRDGTMVKDFLAIIQPPENGTLQMMTEDGREVPISSAVATGQVLEARSANGTLLDHAYMVVKGDVLGTGIANVAQMTTVAEAVLGTRTLTGLRKEAADMNGNNRIDIGDLVAMATILTGR